MFSKNLIPFLKISSKSTLIVVFFISVVVFNAGLFYLYKESQFKKMCQQKEIKDFKKEYKLSKITNEDFFVKVSNLGEIKKEGYYFKSSYCLASTKATLVLIKKEASTDKILITNNNFNLSNLICGGGDDTCSSYDFEKVFQELADQIYLGQSGSTSNLRLSLSVSKITQDSSKKYIISDDQGQTWQISNSIQ
jgi:hypothetical protein